MNHGICERREIIRLSTAYLRFIQAALLSWLWGTFHSIRYMPKNNGVDKTKNGLQRLDLVMWFPSRPKCSDREACAIAIPARCHYPDSEEHFIVFAVFQRIMDWIRRSRDSISSCDSHPDQNVQSGKRVRSPSRPDVITPPPSPAGRIRMNQPISAASWTVSFSPPTSQTPPNRSICPRPVAQAGELPGLAVKHFQGRISSWGRFF